MEVAAPGGERGREAGRQVLTKEAPWLPLRNAPFGTGTKTDSP